MKPITFTLFLILITTLLGCEAQNPICSPNFCFVGEAFPRSELEVNAEFSEIDIDDSRILTTLIGNPPIPTPAEPATPDPQPESDTTLADIVSSVESGSTEYLNQVVTVTGIVAWKNDDNRSLLISENGSAFIEIRFFVTSFNDASILANHIVGNSYTFTALITHIQPSETDPTKTNIFAAIVVG